MFWRFCTCSARMGTFHFIAAQWVLVSLGRRFQESCSQCALPYDEIDKPAALPALEALARRDHGGSDRLFWTNK